MSKIRCTGVSGSLSGKMKLFLAVSALVQRSTDADQDVSIPESCIIAPADCQKLQSTSWGPIWKKLSSCDNDPQVGFQKHSLFAKIVGF